MIEAGHIIAYLIVAGYWYLHILHYWNSVDSPFPSE